MTKIYDVVIIGAGPSGVSCAYNIMRLNPDLRVLLLDKAEFPRYKPCGGGVSPEVANYLDFDLSEAIDTVCQDVIMVANGKEIQSDQYPLWMVRREKFDHFLLAKAKARGAEFIAPATVTDIKEDQSIKDAKNNKVSQVVTDLGIFHTRLVVIGEGGRGNLARKLGFAGKNTVLAAMEYEHYTSELNGKLYIDFDYNNSGYAWNFPKSDGLSLGIGGLIKKQDKGKVGLRGQLEHYSSQFAVAKLVRDNLHGHPILLYSGRQKLVHGNIVLIGEIAGSVDPLTAEGIRPAIKSGFLAAYAISKALKENSLKVLTEYNRAFHREIGRDFYYARIMAYFLNKNLAKVLPMITTPTAVNGFMSVFSGKSSYRQKINLRRISKLIWRTMG